MSNTTQCPSCQTRFKVTDAQLGIAQGMVRCGRCSHVFNALDHLVANPVPAAPAPQAASAPADDFELELPEFDPLGPAETTTTEAPAKPAAASAPQEAEPVESPEPVPANAAAVEPADLDAFQRALSEALHPPVTPVGNPFDHAEPEPARHESAPRRQEPPEAPLFTEPAPPLTPLQDIKLAAQPAPEKPKRSFDAAKWKARLSNTVFGVLGVLGLLLFAGQMVYLNRTRIAAEVPELRPNLEKACAQLGCKVPWPSDAEYIRTEWSEMAFVPEHSNLVQLTATLKNHAKYPQAFPIMELTLKDSEDQVLVRRNFTPEEYLKPDDRKLARFNPNSEVKVIMRMDVGKLHTMGYSLFWYYP